MINANAYIVKNNLKNLKLMDNPLIRVQSIFKILCPFRLTKRFPLNTFDKNLIEV